MFTFHLLAHDATDDTVEFEARDAAGTRVLHAITRVRVMSDSVLVLSDFIVYGRGAGSLGSTLRQVARAFIEEVGCAELHVHGTRRSSGAGPGRIPPPIRFR